ncbi:hypothetical protein [Streptomyces sp. NPDC001492]
MKFLRTRAKSSTKALAATLGVSRSTVERYLSGASKKPQKRLQAALAEATEDQWHPQVRAQARQHATDEDLQPVLAEAITYSYFQEFGTTRPGLRADFTDVEMAGHLGLAAQNSELL